jgi:hypothetical protein
MHYATPPVLKGIGITIELARPPKLTPHHRQEALKRREAGESLIDITRSRPCGEELPGARWEPVRLRVASFAIRRASAALGFPIT